MNVHEIIINHLKSIGADGLAGQECGCGIDDLIAYCDCCKECKPAKKVIATEAGEFWEIGDTIYREIKP